MDLRPPPDLDVLTEGEEATNNSVRELGVWQRDLYEWLRKPVFPGGINIGDTTNYTEIANNGVITLHGDAISWVSQEIEPGATKLPGANPPAEDNIDNFPFHRYDRGTEESTYFHWGVPEDFHVGTASIKGAFRFVVSHPPAAVDEVVVMGFEWKKISEGDVYTFVGGTTSGTISETIVAGETAYISHKTAYGTLDTTGFSYGDTILFRFYRDATNAADTYDSEAVGANNDVWVWNYHLEYLSDKLGET